MKCLDRSAEPARVSPDLVQREQAVKSIKSGVLKAFGHNRPGELLEPHYPIAVGLLFDGAVAFRQLKQQ